MADSRIRLGTRAPPPGSGWGAAPQLPAVAGGILAEHNVKATTVEGCVFDPSALEPLHEGWKFVVDLHCDMRPSRRAMVRILAEVDLLPVLALEPSGLAREPGCELRGSWHPPIAEDVQKEVLLGVRPSNGHSEVHMMQAQHACSLQAACGNRWGAIG
jgi:hypothetical protein